MTCGQNAIIAPEITMSTNIISERNRLIMSIYEDYLKEIETRKGMGFNPKPIDGAELLDQVISQIKDTGHSHRKDSLHHLIYNTLPGTTAAALVKAKFLKEIIKGDCVVPEISTDFAFELLSHMKGGPSVEVLLDLAIDGSGEIASHAAEVLKSQVFLYNADTDRLKKAYESGSAIAKDILESYAKAEFFTKLPRC